MYNHFRKGKREILAHAFFLSGITSLISALPQRNQLIVLNYHRIGNPEEDQFDPGVFSTTADELDAQLAYLKRKATFVNLDEACAYVSNGKDQKPGRCRVLITFDDGYLDNYKVAYPILRSHGVPATFFLTTGLVGTSSVPWWDHISFLVRTARRSRFLLHYPTELDVDLERDGLVFTLQRILRHYKRTDNLGQSRFVQELAEEAQGIDPPKDSRRFLSWEEAREMIRGGMSIGSHTHTHPVLSQLSPEQQWQELSTSKALLEENLAMKILSISYPVGIVGAFNQVTEKLAEDAGYRFAYSFYGGVNLQGQTRPFDIKRFGVDGQSLRRLQLQVATCRATGYFWP